MIPKFFTYCHSLFTYLPRDVPTGYKVVRVPIVDGSPSVDQPIDFLWHDGSDAKWPSGIRPVDVKFDKCNRLLVSTDGTNGNGDGVIIIAYDQYRGITPATNNSNINEGEDVASWAVPLGFFLFWALVFFLYRLYHLCQHQGRRYHQQQQKNDGGDDEMK